MIEQKISDLADAILAEYDFLDGVSTTAEVYIRTKAIVTQYLIEQMGAKQ